MTQYDPFTDPEWLDFVKRAEDDLVPKLRDSGMVISIAPTGETDIKFAVELGLSIMLNKPIIVLAGPGVTLPNKLLRVADEVVFVDMADHKTSGPLVAEAIGRINDKLEEEETS